MKLVQSWGSIQHKCSGMARSFFDRVPPELVAAAGLSMGYSPSGLYLSMCVHLAGRCLSDGDHHSQLVYPACSILAGCMRSISFTRLYLFEFLQKLHDEWKPMVFSTWVDDVVQRQHGKDEEALGLSMGNAAVDFVLGMRTLGAVVSPKSTILASTKKLGICEQDWPGSQGGTTST